MRRAEEQEVLQSFARFLKRSTDQIWAFSADEVENPNNFKNYDCEFTSWGCRPIAADVFRLYPGGSDQQVQGGRRRIIDKLESALRDQGVGGLHITTPFPEKKHVDPRWYQRTAAAFSKAVARNPSAEVYESMVSRHDDVAGMRSPISLVMVG